MLAKFNPNIDVRIEGDFCGHLVARRVFIASGARCSGSIHCDVMMVRGFADAAIDCRTSMVVGPQAILAGELRYQRLHVSQGAFVTATLLHLQQPAMSSFFYRLIQRFSLLERLVVGYAIRKIEKT